MTFPTSPRLSVLRRGIFSKSPSSLIGVITKAGLRVFFNEDFPQLLAKCQEHPFKFLFPLWPLMSRWSQKCCQVRIRSFLQVFEVSPTAISPTGFAPLFRSTPQSEFTVSTVRSDMLFPKKQHTWTTDAAQAQCIRCHKKKKVTAGQDHSEKEW